MNIVEAVSDRKTDRAKLGIHITKFISFFGIGSLAFIFKGWAQFSTKKTIFIINSSCIIIILDHLIRIGSLCLDVLLEFFWFFHFLNFGQL